MIRRIPIRNLLWRLTHRPPHYDESPQGFDVTEVWTPEYVEFLGKNINERYKEVRPIIGRIDRFLLDCASVLDVGCGWMPYTPDNRYTGVDVSSAMLVKAREIHPEIRYIQASAYDLPFEDREFEGVRSSGMLRHMKDWKPALKEMLRVAQNKLAFSHLVGSTEKQCGRYQWCSTVDSILNELPDDASVSTWEIKRWRDFKSVLFTVTLNRR